MMLSMIRLDQALVERGLFESREKAKRAILAGQVRVSFCYDRAALDSRKEHKPKNNVMDMAAAMGIELLTEEQYFALQKLGEFDTKSSSWLKTPAEIRELGGAIYGDRRYGRVFIGHNGAESYYSGRGFRGSLRV